MINQNGSNNDREFLGLTQNECTFQGKVVGDPVIQSDNYAFMQIKTAVSELAANGQWNDVVIKVPVITMDPKKVATIREYVKDGRTLLLHTYYKAWVDPQGQQQYAFVIKKMDFGPKKWVPRDQQVQTPALPVQ